MDQMHHASVGTGLFSRDVTGLSFVRETEQLSLADGDRLELTITPVASRVGDDIVRMLAYNGSIPGPDAARAAGVRDRRARHERRRRRGDRALARAASREPLRRRAARHAEADPGRRRLHLPRAVPRRGPVLVPPAHPRGLHAGLGAVRQHRRRAQRTPTTGRRAIATSCSRSTTSRSRTGSSRRTIARVPTTRDGAVRQRLPRRRAHRLAIRRRSGRGRPLLPHEHGEHPRLRPRDPGRDA